MRNLVITLGLALLMSFGGTMSYADNGHRGQARQEQHKGGNKRSHGNNHSNGTKPGSKGPQGNKHNVAKPNGGSNHNKGHKHVTSAPRPGAPAHRTTPPPPPRKSRHHAPRPPHHYPPRLASMVGYATRGCSNVDVWQVDPNTFVVRYFRNGRYYTQYLYPYANRYGNIELLGGGWSPLSGWISIPLGSLGSLNINL